MALHEVSSELLIPAQVKTNIPVISCLCWFLRRDSAVEGMPAEIAEGMASRQEGHKLYNYRPGFNLKII